VVDALDQEDIKEAKKVVRLHMQRVKDKIEKELFAENSRNNEKDIEYTEASIKAFI
jgi:DNA-binding GntR family transcriptional regulator